MRSIQIVSDEFMIIMMVYGFHHIVEVLQCAKSHGARSAISLSTWFWSMSPFKPISIAMIIVYI